jgi:hypothetical protein
MFQNGGKVRVGVDRWGFLIYFRRDSPADFNKIITQYRLTTFVIKVGWEGIEDR